MKTNSMVGRKEQERQERNARVRAKMREDEEAKYRKQARDYEDVLKAALPDLDVEVRSDALWGRRYDAAYDPDRDLISHDAQPLQRYLVTVRPVSGEPRTFGWAGKDATLEEIRRAFGLES